LAATIASALLAVPSNAAYPAGQNGRIAYDCGEEVSNVGDLCAITPDGSGRVNLTNTGPSTIFESGPEFSPDGRRILFRSAQSGPAGAAGLELINVDGSGRVPLGPTTTDDDLTPFDPAFSPDGRLVFLSRGSFNTGDLYRINSDGSGEVNLTNGAFGAEPDVSHDGMTVAFTRFVDAPCVPPQPFLCSGPEVVVMGIDGSAQRLLSPPGSEENDSAPAFGPDGRIAFERSGSMGRDVWVMNADGSGQRNLTNTPGISERDPEFSPDGTMIVYARDEGLFLMNADGSARRRLASTPEPPGYDEVAEPSWQPIHRCRGRLVTIVGDDGPDTLRGTKGADVIMGFGAKDVIKGRKGNDRICGGKGKDRMIGGGGRKDACAGGKGKDKAKGCERGKP
jgi:TolB protein